MFVSHILSRGRKNICPKIYITVHIQIHKWHCETLLVSFYLGLKYNTAQSFLQRNHCTLLYWPIAGTKLFHYNFSEYTVVAPSGKYINKLVGPSTIGHLLAAFQSSQTDNKPEQMMPECKTRRAYVATLWHLQCCQWFIRKGKVKHFCLSFREFEIFYEDRFCQVYYVEVFVEFL